MQQVLLAKRAFDGSLRSLRKAATDSIDFTSNDYLGFARSDELWRLIKSDLSSEPGKVNGSTGSRLLSGNSAMAEELETTLSDFHRGESALLFNSGYDANLGLFSCIAQRTDTIVYDELCHASIIDGIRLSHAQSVKFRHNNLTQLEEILKKAKGDVYVAAESVYSMDGDLAPLDELAKVCRLYNANLIVDEAHATGVFGSRGEGRTGELKLENKVFARMHTFGKALGCHGAVVICSEVLKNYLVNFSRPFIYSTALPPHSLSAIKAAYAYLTTQAENRTLLFERIRFFREKVKVMEMADGIKIPERSGPIQNVVMSGNDRVKKLAAGVQSKGFDVRAIMSPTVPAGSERLRICLHSFNKEEEIEGLVKLLRSSE